MTDSIVDILDRLNGLHVYLARYKESPLKFRSKLTDFLKGKKNNEAESVSANAVEIAKNRWKQYLATRDDKLILKRDLRILCSVSDIVVTEDFLNFLLRKKEQLPSRLLRALMVVYHSSWDTTAIKTLEQILHEGIAQYTGRHSVINCWQQNLPLIVGNAAPDNVAKTLKQSLRPINECLNSLSLDSVETQFAAAVLVALIPRLCNAMENEGAQFGVYWQYTTDYVLGVSPLRKNDRQRILASLIMTMDRLGAQSHAQTYLKDYILKHPDFGDPRVNTVQWKTFDTKATDVFISWLSEEDLTNFFELIIKDDDQSRKAFWLNYVKSIKNSLVVVGEIHRQNCRAELSNLKRAGRRFVYGTGLDTSAFIMYFGKYVVVEFSDYGNACYVYQASVFPELLESFKSGKMDLRILKDRENAIHKQRHHQSWPAALTNTLLSYGINRDQRW